uniref:ZP domain-containing protein n=1 Tax=Panagrellus redivivus TaxID=6233 RepID=A0A7E5A0P6_PANRE
MWPLVFSVFLLIVHFVNAEVVQGGVSADVVIEAKCDFTIHDGGASGKELKGTQLNSELYYKIRCETRKGYCLQVSNCTVTSAGQPKPYPIIDGAGCTNEPSLFEHVEYLDDFTAGIFNPVPIRFRGAQSGVKFECSTLLTPSDNGKCNRRECPKIVKPQDE